MTNLKQASPWLVALLHALFTYIAVFLLALIIIPALGIAVSFLTPESFDLDAFTLTTMGTAVVALISLLLLWWAAANSAKILSKKYAVTDKRTLLYGSTGIYLVLVAATSVLFPAEPTGSVVWEFVSIALSIILFFIITKKHFADK